MLITIGASLVVLYVLLYGSIVEEHAGTRWLLGILFSIFVLILVAL